MYMCKYGKDVYITLTVRNIDIQPTGMQSFHLQRVANRIEQIDYL